MDLTDQNHDLAGVFPDGRLHDFDQLATCRFTAVCKRETTHWCGDAVTPFEAGRLVVVGGVLVTPGDYAFADAGATVVIPAADIDRVLEVAADVVREDEEAVALMRRRTRVD